MRRGVGVLPDSYGHVLWVGDAVVFHKRDDVRNYLPAGIPKSLGDNEFLIQLDQIKPGFANPLGEINDRDAA